eukprot:CAMPEP_0113488058 /NCGR_PEP_ID=MMETSP0014_2-20120614/25822_1 /TAXON_ID=2857 /ORGANISM="Nitzschia sp." /LENGTH=578 /DNA_ID=CAMNT_0000381761 /DNA_START=95 /DNA_END=1831 /DNA_ORIENTATION=- /assembly_acc=CAM_ASM_000159
MPTPLLYLPLKPPVRYDLVQPLANWLDDDTTQSRFGGGSSNNIAANDGAQWVVPKPTFCSVECRTELLRIASLRNCLAEHLQDSHHSALDHEMLRDCQDYHATLLEFEKRGFPTKMSSSDFDEVSNGGDGGSGSTNNSVNLTWRGAFSKTQHEMHHSLVWDRICTLWNIAALQSAKASFDSDPKSKDGLKIAISYLQQAASNLAVCRQIVSAQIESDEDVISTVDVSVAMLEFWETMCLAQAQTCIYRMANLGGGSVRNHTTLAYLVQGAAPLYNDALKFAQDPRLQSEIPKQCQDWAAQCKAQSLLCQARAHFHMSIEHRLSKTAYGKEIAHLQRTLSILKEASALCNATQVLKEASKLLSSLSSKNKDEYSPMAAAAATIQPDIDNLTRLANDRLHQADIDNCNIYMEAIPPQEDLPEIRSQTMVKRDLPMPTEMLTPRVKLFEWEDDPNRHPKPSAPPPPSNPGDDNDDHEEDDDRDGGSYGDGFLPPPPPPPGYDNANFLVDGGGEEEGSILQLPPPPIGPPGGPPLPPPPAYDLVQPIPPPTSPPPPPAYRSNLQRTDSDLARELQAKFDMEG